jgi:hypothetical protein
MPNAFTATDPRGRRVICTEECWVWHILDYHPALAGLEEEVIATIEHPDIGIFRDADYENRDVYYRRRKGRAYFIKVFVEFEEEEHGRVVTAFLTDSTKSGERWIWPESSD